MLSTVGAKGYEIFSRVIPQPAAKCFVVNLQVFEGPTDLASPVIPLQDLFAKKLIVFRIEFESGCSLTSAAANVLFQVVNDRHLRKRPMIFTTNKTMNDWERSYTTKIWRQPSSIGFSNADALSTSMDPPGEPVISTCLRGHPKPAIQGHPRSGHTEGMDCGRKLGCGKAGSRAALERAPGFPLSHNLNNNITLYVGR